MVNESLQKIERLTRYQTLSTLSFLSPLLRAPLGIPFLYQRITSTTPFNALIGAKSLLSSMTIIHLDGRLDWMVAQRNALLAWTGHTLSLAPRANVRMVGRSGLALDTAAKLP